MKTVAYLRVSTPQQDVRSQRLAILEYARKHDFLRIDDFIEATASGQGFRKRRRKRGQLLDRIDAGTLAGLRDRALLSVMLYSFARVSAVLEMRSGDYYRQGTGGGCGSTRREGGGTTVAALHRAAEALDAHLEDGGLEVGGRRCFRAGDRARRDQDLSGR